MMFAYLASPYSHPDPVVRVARFDAACRVAARLMRAGEPVFSPIAHSHPIERHFDAIQDFEFWMKQDLPLLAAAGRLIVLRLDGWDLSRGVARELEFARERGIPTEFIDP